MQLINPTVGLHVFPRSTKLLIQEHVVLGEITDRFQGWRCQTWPQEGSIHQIYLHVQLYFNRLICQQPIGVIVLMSKNIILCLLKNCQHTVVVFTQRSILVNPFFFLQNFYTSHTLLRNTKLKSCHISALACVH